MQVRGRCKDRRRIEWQLFGQLFSSGCDRGVAMADCRRCGRSERKRGERWRGGEFHQDERDIRPPYCGSSSRRNVGPQFYGPHVGAFDDRKKDPKSETDSVAGQARQPQRGEPEVCRRGRSRHWRWRRRGKNRVSSTVRQTGW